MRKAAERGPDGLGGPCADGDAVGLEGGGGVADGAGQVISRSFSRTA